jgi:Tol biopolymer transport system component
MSADGRFLAFDSSDADLVANDSNDASDVFVRDLTMESTELESQHAAGISSQTSLRGYVGSGSSMTADGRYIAFAASGVGLLKNYTNNSREIIIRDLLTASNFLVSVDQGGLGDANGDSIDPMISADGHFIAFASNATNLVSNDTNIDSDIFVRDLQLSSTALASLNTDNTGSSGGASFSPSISADGRYILFFNKVGTILRDQTAATNYVLLAANAKFATMTPGGRYIAYVKSPTTLYVWDTQLNGNVFTNTISASISSMNICSNGQWIAYADSTGIRLIDRLSNSNRTVCVYYAAIHTGLKFSADGNSLVYATSSINSVDDTNVYADVYVYDIPAGTNGLVSRSFYSGKSANGPSDAPDISGDGRYIVFESTASDIVPNDHNNRKDIFLYDRQSEMTTLLSASGLVSDSANLDSMVPLFTGDRQTIVFHSWATDIITNDFDQRDDLFILKIASTNQLSNGTNPPPVFAGELVFAPSGFGSSPKINWSASSGLNYQVQYKDELTDPAWQPVNGNVTVEGTVGSIIDHSSNPDHRFYRILAY